MATDFCPSPGFSHRAPALDGPCNDKLTSISRVGSCLRRLIMHSPNLTCVRGVNIAGRKHAVPMLCLNAPSGGGMEM